MFRFLLFVVALAALAVRASAAAEPDDAAISEARVIVKFRSNSAVLSERSGSPASDRTLRAEALGRRIGRTLRGGTQVAERAQVVVGRGVSAQALAERLSAEPDVEYAVPDKIRRVQAVPNDPLYVTGGARGPTSGQWYLRAPTSDVKASIDAESAWSVTTGSAAIVVAVIDTGVRADHPDLLPVSRGGNLLPGYDMIADAIEANDGDGRDADATDPGDWVTAAEANDPRSEFYQCTSIDPTTGRYVAQNSAWHGTKVAGLIAAQTNNGLGIASVGRNVRLLPVRVLGKCGEGYDSDIIPGMRWAAGLPVPGLPPNPYPARVISMSLGSEDVCGASYQDVIGELTAKGVVIVAAAGNSSGHAVYVPANCPGVIAVGGLRHVGTKSGFSSLGPEVAISAPGGNCVNPGASDPCLYPITSITNTGTTAPIAPAYTDAYDAPIGTSFSAPLVSGTVALMLSAAPSLSPEQVRMLLQSTARLFPTVSADAASGAVVPQCAAPRPAGRVAFDQLECVCTSRTCGAGMLDAGGAVRAAALGFPAAGLSAQGLWWNAPAESESGWGINLAHQGDVIFATWYTYDSSGKPWWLSMTANRVSDTVYSGTLFANSGPPYANIPFDASRVAFTPVGSGSLSFVNSDFATFSYTVNGIAQSKRITRQAFGALPVCAWGAPSGLASASNYQDLWWNAPANSEPGWGLSIAQEGDAIFAVWYTYDLDGAPLWLSATMNRTGAGWGGTLFRTIGPGYSANPFDPAAVMRMPVGTATLTFADGNAGTFAYTVSGVSQDKAITRQVFRAPGTLCR